MTTLQTGVPRTKCTSESASMQNKHLLLKYCSQSTKHQNNEDLSVFP